MRDMNLGVPLLIAGTFWALATLGEPSIHQLPQFAQVDINPWVVAIAGFLGSLVTGLTRHGFNSGAPRPH